MSPKTTVIINPASAGGKTGKNFYKIEDKVRYFLGNHTSICLTRKPNDAIWLTKKALLTGCEQIVAVGGDGTMNEVINGFFAGGQLINNQSKLGIINCGTDGCLAQSLRLPDDLSQQLGIIKLGAIRKIDCGRIMYHSQNHKMKVRYFINDIQFSTAEIVDKYLLNHQQRLLDSLLFSLTSVKSILIHPIQSLTMEIDHEKTVQGDFFGIIVANGDFIRGGMNLMSHTKLDDGNLNVFLLQVLNVRQRLIAIARKYSGTHIDKKNFVYFPVKHLNINSETNVLIRADGELLGSLPCSVEILPLVISVCSYY